MTPESTKVNAYRPEIDGLRAIAVLLVILHHASIRPFSGGFIGVDVFFVISGFLVTQTIIRDLEQESFSITEFLERRARRIIPALYLMLLTVTLASALILVHRDFLNFFRSLFAVATFWSNIFFYRDVGYFDSEASLKPLLHTWSLGVEEQFYLLLPLLLLSLSRLRKKSWLLVFALLAIASFQMMTQVSTPAAFYLLPFRAWELLAGSICAVLSQDGREFNCKNRPIGPLIDFVAFASLASIPLASILLEGHQRWPSSLTIWPVICTCLLLLTARPRSVTNRLLTSKGLVAVGLSSYSVYLWHNPLFALTRYEMGELGPATTAFLIVLALILGWASWRFVETPFRNAHQIARKKFIGLALGGTLAFGAVAAFVVHVGASLPRPHWQNSAITPKTEMRAVLLVGDSHAAQLVHGLRPWLGTKLSTATAPGCVPLWGVDRYDSRFERGECSDLMTISLRSAIDEPTVKLVMLASMGPIYLDGTVFGDGDQARVTGDDLVLVSDPELRDRWKVYEIGLRDTLARLVAANKKVIVVVDNPELGIDPRMCDPRDSDRCVNPRSVVEGRVRRFRNLVKRISGEFESVSVFDPTSLFCDWRTCYSSRNGMLLYDDQDHLSDDGSDYVGSALGPFVLKVLQGK